MEVLKNGYYSGERALYHKNDLEIYDSIFDDGESPLKECHNIKLYNTKFKWKYPLWYGSHFYLKDCLLSINARSGIWYSDDITFIDSIIDAPKTFRRSSNITLINTSLLSADETLWTCQNVKIENVCVKGDYLLMNSKNVKIKKMNLDGNYLLDGASDVIIEDSKLITKDSFWNSKNVYVKNSEITGEYIGWNSENITFENCTIDSIQAFCYMKNLKLINCTLHNTNLAFEFSTVDATVNNEIESVKNPISGRIEALRIKELILDELLIDKGKTIIKVKE